MQPVCVWNASESSERTNMLGSVVGWDIVKSTTDQSSDTLQTGFMRMAESVDCTNTEGEEIYLPSDSDYCAYYRDGIFCSI